jgi:hypothetical protein
LPGLLLILLGAPLLLNLSAFHSALRAFPRSGLAAGVFFGLGAGWFLFQLRDLSPADFGEYKAVLFVFFAAVAALSFKMVPDFLAVRGVCALVLLGAMPLLMAGYMNFSHGSIVIYKATVYVAIAFAIYLGASPFRLRDFFDWMYRAPARPRWIGGALAAHGLLLSAVAFTY